VELRRKWSYAFARKKAWLPRLAIAGMLTAAGTVLFLLFLPLHGTHIDDEAKHNSLRLRYRLTQLYDNLGLDGKELTERYMLTGLISNAINAGKSPREERTVRYMELVEREDELFVARVLTESLAASFQYLEIRGTVDNYMCGIILSNVTELDLSYYAGKRLGGCAVSTRCIDGVHVNNGSKGIYELLDLADHTQCKKSIMDECERGTVVMDTWANKTLAFQRWLQQNLTFDLIQTLGTHNSFNNKADGYGTGDFILGIILEALSGGKWEFVWAQQWFTMTDQLRMGVRHLMLDPVYFWGKMRLCHCGTTFKWIDDVIDFIEKVLHITIDFDSDDLGCLPHDRTLVAGLQEIYDWVVAPGNEEEIVMVLINDERNSSDWGHIHLIQEPVPQIFGDLLFTPEDKKSLFLDQWPTPTELLKLGKRVIVSCTSRCNDSHIFLDMHVPDWDHDTMKYFTAAPECGGYSASQFYLVGGESQVVGPIYNGPEAEGLVIRENLPYLMQCPVTVSEMDLISPPLIAAAVWTWAPGYSHDNVSNTQCAAVDAEREGRWVVLSCSTQLAHMCQSASNITEIVLSSDRLAWGQAQCPQGYVFSLPQTGYVNWNLYELMVLKSSNTNQVWINLPPV
jgi:hypothetical protein